MSISGGISLASVRVFRIVRGSSSSTKTLWRGREQEAPATMGKKKRISRRDAEPPRGEEDGEVRRMNYEG